MPNRQIGYCRILGNHQRHARALLATVGLQPRAERLRERIELAEGDRLPMQVNAGRAAYLATAFIEDVADRAVFR